MAARKSCTHLTWSQAKNKSGIGSSTGQKKNKEALRKQNHGQVLAAKIIAKQGGGGANNTASDNRKLAKAYKKQEEKAAALAAQRAEERQQKQLEARQEVQMYDKAKEKLSELMQELRRNNKEHDDVILPPAVVVDEDEGANSNSSDDAQQLQEQIVQCKQMQVDELMALEAIIIPGEEEEDDGNSNFIVSNKSNLPQLQEKLERYTNNDGDDSDSLRLSIVNHPPISFYMKVEVDDYREGSTTEDNKDMELNAMILLRVTFPPMYLNSSGEGEGGGSQTPIWDIEYVMVTDKLALASADKPLESLAYLDEKQLQQAMNQHAQDDLLPYPCVYQVVCEWLPENIFDFLTLHPHVLLATK